MIGRGDGVERLETYKDCMYLDKWLYFVVLVKWFPKVS